jgi:biopolymer transport protein TolR
MAEIQESGTGRRKNFEPNLVPFIDLMSVLITFLLITAVWTQVSMVQIGTSVYGKKDQEEKEKPLLPPDVDIVLKLEIESSGYKLLVGKEIFRIPNRSEEFDDASLVSQLERVKQLYPNKQDGALAMEEMLPYERLIKGMDAFLSAGFTQISILTGGPK